MSVIKELFIKVQKKFKGPTPADVLKLCKSNEENPVNDKELLVFAVHEVKGADKSLRMTTMGLYRSDVNSWVNDG